MCRCICICIRMCAGESGDFLRGRLLSRSSALQERQIRIKTYKYSKKNTHQNNKNYDKYLYNIKMENCEFQEPT